MMSLTEGGHLDLKDKPFEDKDCIKMSSYVVQERKK